MRRLVELPHVDLGVADSELLGQLRSPAPEVGEEGSVDRESTSTALGFGGISAQGPLRDRLPREGAPELVPVIDVLAEAERELWVQPGLRSLDARWVAAVVDPQILEVGQDGDRRSR